MAPGHTDSTSGVVKNASKACDRCRGQKLRCVWERSNSRQCQRCARAKAVCVVPRPRPMGRPPRSLRQSRHDDHSEWDDGTSAVYNESASVAKHADADRTKSADSTRSLWSTDADVDLVGDTAEFPWATVEGHFSDVSTDTRSNVISSMPSDLAEFVNLTFPETSFSDHAISGCTINDPNVESGHCCGSDGGQSLETSNSMSSTTTTSHNNVESCQNKAQEDRNLSIGDVGDQLQLLTELCEFNLALYQHPLHRAVEQARQARFDNSNQTAPTRDTDPTLNLADLETGRLLSISVRLRNILATLISLGLPGAEADTAREKPSAPDQSTILLAMSCCARLEVILTSALNTIRDAQVRGLRFKNCEKLMPNFSVDGFTLAHCHDFHLGFVTQTFEKALESIRTSMKATENFHSTQHISISS